MNIGDKNHAWVYFAHPLPDSVVYRVNRNLVKIGISTNLPLRLSVLRLRLICAVELDADLAKQVEFALHKQLADLRRPQWDSTEWFRADGRLRTLIGYMRAHQRWPWDKTRLVRVGAS